MPINWNNVAMFDIIEFRGVGFLKEKDDGISVHTWGWLPGCANHGLCAKSHHTYLIFYFQWLLLSYNCSYNCSCNHYNWVVVTETTCPTYLKIFTIWPITQKVFQPKQTNTSWQKEEFQCLICKCLFLAVAGESRIQTRQIHGFGTVCWLWPISAFCGIVGIAAGPWRVRIYLYDG
jgi:hypothetical protein